MEAIVRMKISTRMEVIGSTKSVAALTLILLCGVYFSSSQPGFLSIDCGGKGIQIDNETGITWIPDDNYIQGGRRESINDLSRKFYQRSLRVFPKPLRKSCYHLPITPNLPFLLRLFFVGFNYTNQSPDFMYSIETQDMLSLRNVTLQTRSPIRTEKIMASGGDVLYICLIRTLEHVDPFISSIELRPLRQGMYYPVNAGLMLNFQVRYNFGADTTIRYPHDPFDRLWDGTTIGGAEIITSVEEISTKDTKDFPPPAVMETAVATDKDRIDVSWNQPTVKALLLLYFAEIRNSSESSLFDIFIDNVRTFKDLRLLRNRSAVQMSFLMKHQLSSFTLFKKSTSTSGPIINGLELYGGVATLNPTALEDVQALAIVKETFKLSNWISDPCFTIPWEGINCSNTSGIVRVSEINLSGKNLRGSIPTSLANMTALINVSLANNHLTGSLPNLSRLVKLERLHLQNNSLTGKVPDWFSELHNLAELFIENNNFSGVIPQRLMDATLLNLTRGGNPYLCMKKGQCRRSSLSNGSKQRTMAGAIVGPIAIVGLLLLLGIIIYRRKFRIKEIFNSGTKGSTPGNRESIYVRGQDFSMVLVPNSTKTRSFTLEEMITATENFIHKIGQGGFGSVFHGKLHEGKQIAVKVLSSFSKQGAVEFLNEIDLLSRVHHKNLVSLLGYCNESRELMLAYEYMPGGSLKDHLYGDNTKLDWRTRLKIALDAAYGLEYLHVGCTPKIIHRDVKTANILLDANLNGKLADFGLSRVTIDGEASHVTTAVKGTAGYLDPEYFSTQMLTEKSDVYSFGVVLLEIICGRRPIDVKLSEQEVNLIRWVTPYMEADSNPLKISNIVDKMLQLNDKDVKSVIHLAKLAIRCVRADPLARPTVSEVIAEIKVAIKYEEENNAREVDDDSEVSENYGDRMSSQASVSDSSGPKEIGSSQNIYIFPR